MDKNVLVSSEVEEMSVEGRSLHRESEDHGRGVSVGVCVLVGARASVGVNVIVDRRLVEVGSTCLWNEGRG